ncbi:MAG: hypothetical protein M5U28_27910 [Sandaracinaceae bacterium]|nr:hypothetical protein [Sandaracinaceae bacterium]
MVFARGLALIARPTPSEDAPAESRTVTAPAPSIEAALEEAVS